MARLRDLEPGRRVITRSGFAGTVVVTSRMQDIWVVMVDLDALQGLDRNPVVCFPEFLIPVDEKTPLTAGLHVRMET
jgi:hypothetical protein